MEIVRLKTKDLVSNTGQIEGLPSNPREWTASDIIGIAKSLKETPELFEMRPCLVYEQEGKYVILGGNLRYEGAKKNKEKEVPCIIVPEGTPIDKLKEIVIKDNGAFGAWDFDALANEWDDLPLTDWGVVGAWDTEMKESGVGGEEGEAKEDDFDTNNEVEARCKRGDIWQLGEHRLMCGDSTSAEDVARLMNGEKADMSFTSPPYNAGTSENLSGNTHTKGSKYAHSDDNVIDYLGLISKSTECSIEQSKYSFVNLQMLANNKIDICSFLNKYKNSLCDILIWNKTNTAPAMAERVCNSQYEFIFVFNKENNSRAIGTKTFRGDLSNVFTFSPQRGNEYSAIHAATFSVGFVSHYITSFSNENEIILDLFGGTGTTMIACEQLNRKARLMEIDPTYCDVILARWETLTGKKAEKLE